MQAQNAPKSDGSIGFNLAGKIVLLCGLSLPAYALAALTPILPAIAATFASDPQAGALTRMLVSIIGVTVAITSPFVGALADRYGPRRILLIAIAAYSLAGCAPFFLNDLYLILASRAAIGVASAGIGAVILVILITRSSGAARDRWLGYLSTASTLSSLFYMPIVGYIGHFGWHWAFLTYAIALPILVLAMIGIAPDPARPSPSERQSIAPAIGEGSTNFVLGTPLTFILFMLVAGTVLVTPMLYIPFRLHDMGITDPAVMSMLLISGSITGAIGGFTYGALRSKFSLSAAFAIAFFAMAAGLLLTATATFKAQVVLGQMVFGYSLGAGVPNLYALASVAGADAFRARTVGFCKTGIYAGPMIGQILLEPVIAHTNAGFVLCLLASAAMSLALLFIWRMRTENVGAA